MAEAMPNHAGMETAAERFLPHRGSAHMISEVLESNAERMICTGRFPANNPLITDGRAATYLAVEPAAQAAATHLALLAVDSGVDLQELSGFLTSVKNLNIHRPWVPAETDLRIEVTPRGHARGLSKYLFELSLNGELVCDGELSSFVQNQVKPQA